RTLKRIRSAFASEADELEVTAECNPSSLSPAHAAALRDAGVTRVSLGVQSLRDEHLRFLGRLHDSATALIALEAAVREVPRVSADLMFGMPKQTPEALSEDVSRLVDAGVEHVSAYALTIEPRTLFGSLHKTGRLEVATEDRYADLFETAHAKFAAFGFDHYEVSNYARDGKVSQHNLHYWHGGAYVGLGSSAVGCLDHGVGRALRWRNEPIPQRYMAEPCKEGEAETLGPTELVREALMLGLRTSEGVDVGATERRAGQAIELGRERDVARALDRGDLVAHEGRLRVPQDRWLKLDGIVRDLF
ncbi:MAG: coproporphyrinogen-III oxidase family protein, partial [Myxococcota bacterium]